MMVNLNDIKANDDKFEITNPKPSKETVKALKEVEDILSGRTKAKGYNDINLLFKDLDSD